MARWAKHGEGLRAAVVLAACVVILAVIWFAGRGRGQDGDTAVKSAQSRSVPSPLGQEAPSATAGKADGGGASYVTPDGTPILGGSAMPPAPPHRVLVQGEYKAVDVPTAGLPWYRERGKYAAEVVDLALPHSLSDPPPLEIERAAAENAGKDRDANIELTGDFECGYLASVTKISPTHFVADFRNEQTRMFLFRVKGAAGRTVRVDLANVAVDAWGPRFGDGRWNSLNPVFSYVHDLADIASFESSRVEPVGPPTAAYNGPMIPDTSGQKWDFIRNVWVEGTTLCLIQKFDHDDAYVAMKYPYTASYNEAYIKHLSGKEHVRVMTIGESMEGRPLQLVKIAEGGPEEQKTKPCVLLYAREHADEHDTSWAVQGAINFLAGQEAEARTLRQAYVWLFIPLLDPDAAVTETHESVIKTFSLETASRESLAYAEFFRTWADFGNRLDIVINLHNVESGEMPHLTCPQADPGRLIYSCDVALLKDVCAKLALDGLSYRSMPGARGNSPTRLGGYLSEIYGALHSPYELNSQEANVHLSLDQLRRLGEDVVRGGGAFLKDDVQLRKFVDDKRSERLSDWMLRGKQVVGFPALKGEYEVRGHDHGAPAAEGDSGP